MRVDELLAFLRERYALHIDRLIETVGFVPARIKDRHARRVNVRAFAYRLREIEFFRDLPDAYVTQTVRSWARLERCNLGGEAGPGGRGSRFVVAGAARTESAHVGGTG